MPTDQTPWDLQHSLRCAGQRGGVRGRAEPRRSYDRCTAYRGRGGSAADSQPVPRDPVRCRVWLPSVSPAGAAWSSWCCPGKTAKPELKTALRGSLLANGPKVVSTPPGASAGGPDTHVSWARTDVQAGQGPRRQSLRLPREPLLPTQTPDQLHHPREGRPGSQPQEARLPRRTTTEVRQERLHLRRMPSSVSEYSTRGGTSS